MPSHTETDRLDNELLQAYQKIDEWMKSHPNQCRRAKFLVTRMLLGACLLLDDLLVEHEGPTQIEILAGANPKNSPESSALL